MEPQKATPKGVLKAPSLYWLDNGRIACGTLGCAGTTAFFSGRTISGHPVHKVTTVEAAGLAAEGFQAKCETCGKAFTR